MKKFGLLLVVLLAFMACQNQEKVAFVDNTKVIDDYLMKLEVEQKYESQSAAFNAKRDSIGRLYQMEIQTIQMKLSTMSQRKQEEESQKFQQKWQPIQQQMQFEQQQMEQSFQAEMDSLIINVNRFVESYGKTNGYTFVLGKNRAGSVLYGAEDRDITTEVTTALNEDYESNSITETKDKVPAKLEEPAEEAAASKS